MMSGIVHLFNGLRGPRVCLVGVQVRGLMETPPLWHATIYKYDRTCRMKLQSSNVWYAMSVMQTICKAGWQTVLQNIAIIMLTTSGDELYKRVEVIG